MYVYNVGIIDRFKGLIHLSDYIKELDNEVNEIGLLRNFVGQALCEAYFAKKGIGWEGDLRNESIYIGGMAESTLSLETQLFLVIKQDNNGSTFLISPIPFEHLRENLIGDENEEFSEFEYPQNINMILDHYF